MTKPDGLAPEAKDEDSPSWGTWEELILAFAVNRHGTASWDSIASELQKRTSDPNLCLTAHNCRLKYLDLKRRFSVAPNDVFDGIDAEGHGQSGKSSDEESAAPLLLELRKLRVSELRREVHRYDLNIESMELKVKMMEEDREINLRREESELDLDNNSEEKRDIEPEAEPASVGEPPFGEDMDKDQLSVNESNSTDPGAERLRTGEKESEPFKTVAVEVGHTRAGLTGREPIGLKFEPGQKSVREDSCNGSSNSIEKSDRTAKQEPVSDSAELVESEAGPDGEEEAAKENSDLQSTASRSRKEDGSDKLRRGNTSGDEREHEDQSRAMKGLSAESQPLFEFLQCIRAHKLGSVFERRLRSQETLKYQKLILQHIDLETVETRLKQGCYSSSNTKFFRDLLLLVNNALVFFPQKSDESNAANEIRILISKELSHKKAKSDSSSRKQISLQSLSMSKKDEPDETPHSLMLKPRLPGSLIVCRKRSSIAAKSSDKKKEQTSSEKDSKKLSPADGNAEELKITKKRTSDNRFSSPTPSSITKKNNGKNNQANINTKQQGKGGGGVSSSEAKPDSKKSQQTTSDSKKRGAANFLNRMKQGSSLNNGDLLDALKSTPLTVQGNTCGKGGSKNEYPKKGEKKEQATRRSTMEARQTKEKDSPAKRNVGRPPKRGAPPPASGKRSREKEEAETPPMKQQPKKRARKL